MTDLENDKPEENLAIEFSEAEIDHESPDVPGTELSCEEVEEVPEVNPVAKKRKRRRRTSSAQEIKLSGRQSLCESIAVVAPKMLKTVKLRVLG